LAAKALERLGAALPDGPRRTQAPGLSVVGVGPRRWLLVRDGADSDFAPGLAADLHGLAAVCLQSDAYALFQVAGPMARNTLAKGVSIDLHPLAFDLSSAAVTQAAHVGVILWQIDEAPVYELAVPRSYERSFWAWLGESADEFGPRSGDGAQ
jgi:sarcosine oxidase subunit gamma